MVISVWKVGDGGACELRESRTNQSTQLWWQIHPDFTPVPRERKTDRRSPDYRGCGQESEGVERGIRVNEHFCKGVTEGRHPVGLIWASVWREYWTLKLTLLLLLFLLLYWRIYLYESQKSAKLLRSWCPKIVKETCAFPSSSHFDNPVFKNSDTTKVILFDGFPMR